jgi:hypothetical protein
MKNSNFNSKLSVSKSVVSKFSNERSSLMTGSISMSANVMTGSISM